MSFVKLEKRLARKGKLYIKDPDNIAVDYAAFDGPVLLSVQPGSGMALIREVFRMESQCSTFRRWLRIVGNQISMGILFFKMHIKYVDFLCFAHCCMQFSSVASN